MSKEKSTATASGWSALASTSRVYVYTPGWEYVSGASAKPFTDADSVTLCNLAITGSGTVSLNTSLAPFSAAPAGGRKATEKWPAVQRQA